MISINVKDDKCDDALIEIEGDKVSIFDSFITIEAKKNDLCLLRVVMGNGCGICYEFNDKQGKFRFEFTDYDAFHELAKIFVIEELNYDR